ncbi:MAG: hypothetical protein CMJ40_05530 [Phycisphaerae bacterium]|nr:hypothetical protein [Phycisphaerae bacterium]|tara:strand:- start:9072 stop:9656 length:585 start_codon:yes stop_codon:yes gene_type:complete
MKNTLMSIALSGAGLAGIVQADVLVEFSLYTDTNWDQVAYDVTMQIEGIDLMGSMPDGLDTYNLEMQVTGNPQLGGLPFPINWSGQIDGFLSEYEGEGWGSLGFYIPDTDPTFEIFYPGANDISMEWGGNWDWDEEGNEIVTYSYGLATLTGGLADAVGLDVLYLNNFVETTIPAPAALGLLGVGIVAGRRRRR